MMVVVAADGKLFHLAACPLIHEESKRRTITAAKQRGRVTRRACDVWESIWRTGDGVGERNCDSIVAGRGCRRSISNLRNFSAAGDSI